MFIVLNLCKIKEAMSETLNVYCVRSLHLGHTVHAFIGKEKTGGAGTRRRW